MQRGAGGVDTSVRAVTARADIVAAEQTLAQVVDTYMTAHSLTLQQMSDATGLSIATIAALRAGTRGKRPQPTTVAKLAEVMGFDVAVLNEAVAAGGGPARVREAQLLERFRELDESDKATVEQLLVRLVGASRERR